MAQISWEMWSDLHQNITGDHWTKEVDPH